jgi:ribosomal protein S18
MFSKRKSCYFSAKKTQPDWKDPSTYSWLVNEFGKISPARVTGLRPKYQRMATSAIKRGRCMGLISYMSNNVAR